MFKNNSFFLNNTPGTPVNYELKRHELICSFYYVINGLMV